MRTLSAGQLCCVLGTASGEPFSAKTLDNWCRAGAVTPIADRGGHGNHRVFSVVNAVAIACGRGLRANGFALEVAAAVMAAVNGFSEERLLLEFAQRKTCIVFLGQHVFGSLMNTQQALAAGKEFEALHPEMFDLTGLRPQAIDVERVYRNILKVIEQEERREKVTA